MDGIYTPTISSRPNADIINASILKYVGMHPRASIAVIAKSLDLPITQVTSQMHALHARGGLQIRPVLNVDKAGRLFVFCKLAINSATFDHALSQLAQCSQFVTVSSMIGGRYNAFVYFTFSDMNELHDIIANSIMKIHGVCEIETSLISGSLLFNPQYLNYGKLSPKPDIKANAEILALEAAKCGLDELDVMILAELQCDGRKSLRAIARDHDVSPGTVRYRLQRLESEGIITFISFVDPAEISLSCFMIVEVSIDPEASASIVERLSHQPWLTHLLEVVGASNLIAFVNTPDLHEAHFVISNQIRAIAGVRSIAVRTIMDTIKLDPRWGFLTSSAA